SSTAAGAAAGPLVSQAISNTGVLTRARSAKASSMHRSAMSAKRYRAVAHLAPVPIECASLPHGRRNAMAKIVCAAMIALAAGLTAASAQTSGTPSQQGNPMSTVSPDVLKDLAPTGKVRAAINLGNMVLAQKDPASGQPKGITPDLAHELGRRLGVP